MLELIRNRAQGIFAWIIVSGIIITFALFGINQYFSGGGDNSVARVNGAPISQNQLERAYSQQRQRLTEMFGGKLPPMFSEQMIKQQVLGQLVSREVLVQAALESGMRVGNAQLVGIISSAEVFQENGKFARSKYEQLLNRQGMTPGQFEAGVRRDILASTYESGFRDTAFVTKAEVDNLLRLQNQQRTIGYLTVAIAPYEKEAKVSDDEINTYYQDNSQRFMQPERVKIAYLDLDIADLAKAVKVDEQALRSRYEAQKINYSTPEQRRASHILIKVAEDASPDVVEKARKKAEAILARARKGEDFAKLAKAESEDSGSAKKGGDLDFFGKGAMVPAFEEASFKLKKGEISDLVRSPFGFHVIKLTDIRGGDVKPFDKVKDQIRKDIQNEQAEKKFYDMAEQLENLTYEHPESLQLAADALGLPIKTSDYFSRKGGKGIAANPKVVTAAFADDVLLKGNNSSSVELGRNHVVVMRIKDHQPEAVRPLAEVKEQVISTLKREKALSAVKKKAAELLSKVRGGTAPAKLSESKRVTWTAEKALKRDAEKVDKAILQQAFSLPKPHNGSVSNSVALATGDQAVIVLTKVVEGDPAKADEKQRAEARSQLQRAVATASTEAAMSGARARMDIVTKK
jgi:peptidyl-prolyl cis-trans isomerase D